jgi:hypothetical protein
MVNDFCTGFIVALLMLLGCGGGPSCISLRGCPRGNSRDLPRSFLRDFNFRKIESELADFEERIYRSINGDIPKEKVLGELSRRIDPRSERQLFFAIYSLFLSMGQDP